MTNYRRNFVPAGSYFFTVNLAERRLRLLTENIATHPTGFNPVKHGHVGRVQDWPYSLFHRMVRLGVYPTDWAGDVRDPGGRFGERS